MPIRLVVGLGNPGDRYRDTRHNVGFMLVDRLAGSADWKSWKGLGEFVLRSLEGILPDGRRVVAAEAFLVKPLTYMNESGRLVAEFAAYHGKILPDEVLVCFDDLDLPVGRIRVRKQGSSGGHRGMQSIIDHLGTSEIPRLRVGIGPRPEWKDAKEFVLEGFRSDERDLVTREALARAEAAVLLAVHQGIDTAMNLSNAPEAGQ